MGGGNADTLHAASSTRRGRSGEERGAEGRLIFFFLRAKGRLNWVEGENEETGGGGLRPTQVRGRKNKNIKDMDIYFLTDKERLNSDSHIIFEYLNIF